jgi:GTP-binding protein EngB required for normal cell division
LEYSQNKISMKRLVDIPFVRSSSDLLASRFWRRLPPEVAAVKNKKKGKRNQLKRYGLKEDRHSTLMSEKRFAEDSLRWLGVQLKTRMLDDLKAFPSPSTFHPLDRRIIELSIEDENACRFMKTQAHADKKRRHNNVGSEHGDSAYIQRIRQARSLALEINGLVNETITEDIASANTPQQAQRYFEEGKEKLRQLLSQRYSNTGGSGSGGIWEHLCNMSIFLRGLPILNVDLPTVTLVGPPNVGKSSLVRALSSGRPEVNHYPFTTRGILIGHLKIEEDEKMQIVDTPGILHRPFEERNNIEKLTFAVLDHSNSTIIFVMDFSEYGPSFEDQVQMRKLLREIYCSGKNTHRVWFDVVSKCDITSASFIDAFENELGDSRIFRTSTLGSKFGIRELQRSLLHEHCKNSCDTYA